MYRDLDELEIGKDPKLNKRIQEIMEGTPDMTPEKTPPRTASRKLTERKPVPLNYPIKEVSEGESRIPSKSSTAKSSQRPTRVASESKKPLKSEQSQSKSLKKQKSKKFTVQAQFLRKRKNVTSASSQNFNNTHSGSSTWIKNTADKEIQVQMIKRPEPHTDSNQEHSAKPTPGSSIHKIMYSKTTQTGESSDNDEIDDQLFIAPYTRIINHKYKLSDTRHQQNSQNLLSNNINPANLNIEDNLSNSEQTRNYNNNASSQNATLEDSQNISIDGINIIPQNKLQYLQSGSNLHGNSNFQSPPANIRVKREQFLKAKIQQSYNKGNNISASPATFQELGFDEDQGSGSKREEGLHMFNSFQKLMEQKNQISESPFAQNKGRGRRNSANSVDFVDKSMQTRRSRSHSEDDFKLPQLNAAQNSTNGIETRNILTSQRAIEKLNKLKEMERIEKIKTIQKSHSQKKIKTARDREKLSYSKEKLEKAKAYFEKYKDSMRPSKTKKNSEYLIRAAGTSRKIFRENADLSQIYPNYYVPSDEDNTNPQTETSPTCDIHSQQIYRHFQNKSFNQNSYRKSNTISPNRNISRLRHFNSSKNKRGGFNVWRSQAKLCTDDEIVIQMKNKLNTQHLKACHSTSKIKTSLENAKPENVILNDYHVFKTQIVSTQNKNTVDISDVHVSNKANFIAKLNKCNLE